MYEFRGVKYDTRKEADLYRLEAAAATIAAENVERDDVIDGDVMDAFVFLDGMKGLNNCIIKW